MTPFDTSDTHYLSMPEADLSTDVGEFRSDVLAGLQATPKQLSAKYFYDKRGDQLFQQIMNCPEYYLTKCETEIFRTQTKVMAGAINGEADEPFDLIELGVGDGTKSSYLLHELLTNKASFNYVPIDISGHVLSQLERNLSHLTTLTMHTLQGDNLKMLHVACNLSRHRKVVLFLGANIGNMDMAEAQMFCQHVRKILQPGDQFIIGFDLKKSPQIILDAYNDRGGITRDFNLHLLQRINTELNANFETQKFHHYAMYDPHTGACKSYLVSKAGQTVLIGAIPISFQDGEWIYMEISQKYDMDDVHLLAHHSGFTIQHHFTDSKKWFIDSLWKVM